MLIVDDESQCCSLFKDYFSKQNYLVDVAYDGRQAKDLLECNKYDYVFFDCNMPELSGVELIKVIKENNPQARKIMISGYDLVNEEFAKYLGIDIFLRKPFSLKDTEKAMGL